MNSKILDLFQRYLNPHDRVAHAKPLISGRDLLQHLEIKPGPKVGQLLTEVQIANIEGKINNKEEALAFASSLASQGWTKAGKNRSRHSDGLVLMVSLATFPE